MALHPIDSIEELKNYIRVAIQLEHATIPPYLTALYSIHPATNIDAVNVIRTVAVEEMLHLTLAANLLNAVGGTPDLTVKGFIPDYPTYLPNGETDFEVSLQKFSHEAVETFLNIERPAVTDNDEEEYVQHVHLSAYKKVFMHQVPAARSLELKDGGSPLYNFLMPAVQTADHEHLSFYSIDEFYQAIKHGLEELVEKLGEATVFCGDASRQVTSEYYYSGGGDIIPIYDLASASEAIDLISEQGEGHDGGIYDEEQELSHYYRFRQLQLGNYYHAGDEPGAPSGEPLQIDWDAVYPIKPNAKIADFPEGSELRAAAVSFNDSYKNF